MRRRKVDNSIERQICTAMIISDDYCKEIVPLFDHNLVETPLAKIVCGWCVDFFKQYEKAPGRDIEPVFKAWAKKRERDDPDSVDLVESYLEEMSDEHKRKDKFNWKYHRDRTKERFLRQAATAHIREIEEALETGSVVDVEKAVRSFDHISRDSEPVDEVEFYSDDPEDYSQAFDSNTESLFTMPEGLGDLVNSSLTRSQLIGVMGSEKIGKTWWLAEFAQMAVKARCNVAFFAIGDMSKDEMFLRHQIRVNKKSNLSYYCGEQPVPVPDCTFNQVGTCNLKFRKGREDLGIEAEKFSFKKVREIFEGDKYPVNYKPCTECLHRNGNRPNYQLSSWYEWNDFGAPLDQWDAFKKSKRFKEARLGGRSSRIASFPSGSINVRGLDSLLDIWEDRDGWVADLIVIDYADVMDAEDEVRRGSERDQENARWIALRRMSQERHALVIVATQADADSYSGKLMTRKNFSNDKRKLSHVSGMLGLNQSDDQKEAGIILVNWIVRRHGEFLTQRTAKIHQHLQSGQVHLTSFI